MLVSENITLETNLLNVEMFYADQKVNFIISKIINNIIY